MVRSQGRAAGGRLGSGADGGGRGLAKRSARAMARAAWGFWPRRRPPWRRCICSRRLRAASAATTSIIACASWIFAGRRASPPIRTLGLKIADVEIARGRAGRRLEPAPRDADAGASHSQGRGQGRRQGGVPQSARVRVFVPRRSLWGRRGSGRANSPPSCTRPRRRRTSRFRRGVRAATVNDGHRALAAALNSGAAPRDHPRHARAAASRLLGTQGARRRARRLERRERRTHHRGRQCRRRVPRGGGAASRTRRRARGRGGAVGPRNAGESAQGLCAVRRHRSGR